MYSIFKKRKPKVNDEENEIEADADIDDPGMAGISITSTCTTHTSDADTTLDLGNKDSGPCRPILTVRFILFTYKNLIIRFLSFFK